MKTQFLTVIGSQASFYECQFLSRFNSKFFKVYQVLCASKVLYAAYSYADTRYKNQRNSNTENAYAEKRSKLFTKTVFLKQSPRNVFRKIPCFMTQLQNPEKLWIEFPGIPDRDIPCVTSRFFETVSGISNPGFANMGEEK